jgi:hypothetical protein
MNDGDLKGWRANKLAALLNVDIATARKIKTGELRIDQIAQSQTVGNAEPEDHTERDGE